MVSKNYCLVFFVIIGGLAATTVADLNWQATLNGPNTTGEAGKVFYARKAQIGAPLFPRPDAPPYYPAIHGALLHWSVGFIGRQFASDIDGLYVIGRTVTIVLTITAVLLACRILRELGCSVARRIIFTVLVFAPFEIVQHSVSYRPDNWNLCLSVLACFLLLTRRERPWDLAILVMLPAIAFFIKAPGICLGAPIVLGLCLKGKPVTGVACGACSLAIAIGCVLALNDRSDGLFIANLRGGAGVPGSAIYPFMMLIGSPLVLPPLFAPMLFAGEVARNSRRDGAVWRFRVLGAFWLGSLSVSLLSSMRSGSNLYYFLEPYVYGCLILVGWFGGTGLPKWVHFEEQTAERRCPSLPRLRGGWEGFRSCVERDPPWSPRKRGEWEESPEITGDRLSRGRVIQWALWLYLLMGAALIPSRLVSRPTNNAIDKTMAFAADRRLIADAVNRRGLACYSDDGGLNVLLHDPKVVYPYVHNALVQSGYLSPETTVGSVRRREYDLIALTGMRLEHQGIENLAPGFFEALELAYKKCEGRTRYQIYAPRDRTDRPMFRGDQQRP